MATEEKFQTYVADATKNYKVRITEISLKVFYINVSPGVLLGHAEAMKHQNARYHYIGSEVKTFEVASGSYNINLDDVFQGKVPLKAVLFCIK